MKKVGMSMTPPPPPLNVLVCIGNEEGHGVKKRPRSVQDENGVDHDDTMPPTERSNLTAEATTQISCSSLAVPSKKRNQLQQPPSYGSQEYWEKRYSKQFCHLLDGGINDRSNIERATTEVEQTTSAISADATVVTTESNKTGTLMTNAIALANARYDCNSKANEAQPKDPAIETNVLSTSGSMASNKKSRVCDEDDEDDEDGIDDDSIAVKPFHSWYFAYQDLRPLILPLILGGREELLPIFHDSSIGRSPDDEGEGQNKVDSVEGLFIENQSEDIVGKDSSNEDETQGFESSNEKDQQKSRGSQTSRSSVLICPETKNEKEHNEGHYGKNVEDNDDEESAKDDLNDRDDDDDERIIEEEEEEEECDELIQDEEDDDDDDDDDDENNVDDDEGLARHGPIRVLEIGCGDVPMGIDLAKDMLQLEKQQQKQELELLPESTTTLPPVQNIIKEIVCTDYSQIVINVMKTKQLHESSVQSIVKFDVADARSFRSTTTSTSTTASPSSERYKDGSFELILDKGTLDATLSDPVHGISNCIKIVRECARLLTPHSGNNCDTCIDSSPPKNEIEPDDVAFPKQNIATPVSSSDHGCMVIVSHLNAHSESGMEWLRDVLIAGLLDATLSQQPQPPLGTTDDVGTNLENNPIPIPTIEWEIEVHGNGDEDIDGFKKAKGSLLGSEAADVDLSSVSLGPAVYIIHKRRRKNKENDTPLTSSTVEEGTTTDKFSPVATNNHKNGVAVEPKGSAETILDHETNVDNPGPSTSFVSSAPPCTDSTTKPRNDTMMMSAKTPRVWIPIRFFSY